MANIHKYSVQESQNASLGQSGCIFEDGVSDITGKEIADYDEGTLCKKCHQESLFWANDTPNHIK